MKRHSRAFTLIEVLVVLAILAVLGAIVAPAIYDRHPGPARNVSCLSNMKQMSLGFLLFAQENDGQLPWQLATTNEGTLEVISSGNAALQYQPMSNYIKSMAVYICPFEKVRTAATGYDTLMNSNLSYFVNVDVVTSNAPSGIMGGDRHLIVNGTWGGGRLGVVTTNSVLGWTSELHYRGPRPIGGLTFMDGHSEIVDERRLNDDFKRQYGHSSRLVVP